MKMCDDSPNVYSDDIIICINSLLKVQYLGNDRFTNYIIYLDEVNSLIESITHNETLDKHVKIIHQILVRMIKKCNKMVVSYALISDNVLQLQKNIDMLIKSYS